MDASSFSYDEAAAQAPAAAAAPGAVFTDTGQPGTPAQQAFYRGLAHGTNLYASKPAGTAENPYGLKAGETPPAGAYYVDVDGHLQTPQAGSGEAAGAAPAPQPASAAVEAPAAAPGPSAAAPEPGAGSFSYEDAGAGPAAGAAKPVSEGLGFAEGLMKPLANAESFLSKVPVLRTIVGADDPNLAAAHERAARWLQGQEQTAQPGKIGQFAGEVAGTLPAMAMPGGPLVQGAAAGAMLTDNPNDALDTAKSAAGAALGGYAGGKVLGALGSVAAPKVSADVQTLLDHGVTMTPGQIAGGVLKRLEDAATSIPFLGDAIRTAQRRSVESFNRAALSRALDPIGETLPGGVNVGRDGIGYVQDRLGAAYDAVAPQLTAEVDLPFVHGVGTIRTNIAPRALDALPTFDGIVKDSILARMDPHTGALDGQAAKDAQSEIGQAIAKFSGSSEPKTQALVKGLEGLKDELNASIARNSAPDAAARLGKINEAYANFVRLQRAAGSVGTEKTGGLFTPAQLSAGVRASDNSVRKGSFARGGALLQDLSSAGQSVLPPSVPDSGTAMRAFLAELPMIIGFGAESQHFLPKLATAGIVSGIPGLAYTKAGQKAVEAAMTSRPWTAAQSKAVMDALRPLMVEGGAAGASSAAKKLPQLPAPAR